MAMPEIVFRLQMFRGDWDQIWSQMRLLWAMEGLCRINQTHLRQMEAFRKRGLVELSYPPLYRSGVHYETEKGTEIWPDYPSLLSGVMGRGVYPGVWGDCEDLACVRVAEWRELPFHFARKSKATPKGFEVGDPRFPQGEAEVAAAKAGKDWPGWQRKKGGAPAKPFAKWRRGPAGNYHYHALTLLPDGRLEDPSLVLGMGREREFHGDGMAEKLRSGAAEVRLQFAKAPDVMVVDPEKPSGYAGGKGSKLDKKILELVRKGQAPEGTDASLGDLSDPEVGAYLTNVMPAVVDGELDIDALIGWSRREQRFAPKTTTHEVRRLLGYGGR